MPTARARAAEAPNDLTAAAGRGAAPRPAGGGPEIVSPCLTEAALMSRVLEPRAYVAWLDRFLPPLQSGRFAPLTEADRDSDVALRRGAGRGGAGADTSANAATAAAAALATERARLAGLSFARAQAMERIARALPATDPRVEAWHRLSAIQADRGFELMRDDSAGISWLPAQALLYETLRKSMKITTRTIERLIAIAATSSRRRPPRRRRIARIRVGEEGAGVHGPRLVLRVAARGRATAVRSRRPRSCSSAMPLSCMDHPQPRPNAAPYLWEATFTPVPDFETTRAFYGCYDWHSAVNSAWTLVRILKMFPDLPTAPAIRQKLNDHFGATNIAGDLEFMRGAGTFELPYGYAWLLRLQYELRSWNDSDAVRWAANIQPMATYMSERMITYLKGLQQPVRTGVHPNTAMAMDNALGYARAFDPALEAAIRESAERLFKRDIRCNTAAEPGPSDFASPCLMEASIMGQLMDRDAFLPWLDAFLPPLYSAEFRPLTKGLGPGVREESRGDRVEVAHRWPRVRPRDVDGRVGGRAAADRCARAGAPATRRDPGGDGISADGRRGIRRVALLRELGDDVSDHDTTDPRSVDPEDDAGATGSAPESPGEESSRPIVRSSDRVRGRQTLGRRRRGEERRGQASQLCIARRNGREKLLAAGKRRAAASAARVPASRSPPASAASPRLDRRSR